MNRDENVTERAPKTRIDFLVETERRRIPNEKVSRMSRVVRDRVMKTRRAPFSWCSFINLIHIYAVLLWLFRKRLVKFPSTPEKKTHLYL